MGKKDQKDEQGTPGEGRFYLPPSVAPKDEKSSDVPGTPEGRFYLPSADDKAGESVAENPVEQAGIAAGEPPSKDEVKAAKAEAKAGDAGTTEPADPAAATVQPDPVVAAGELAQEPPAESVEEPKGNASRDEWAAYATHTGAQDEDLLGSDGNALTRDELRAKYGSQS